MNEAIRYLLARRLPASKPWELATLALACALPAPLLLALAPESLPDAQQVLRWGALVAIPLYWVVRVTSLWVALRRGGTLDEMSGSGLHRGQLLEGLFLAAAGRAAASAVACAGGLMAGALLLPSDLRGLFMTSAAWLPLLVPTMAFFGVWIALVPAAALPDRPAQPRRRCAEGSAHENPVLFREGLRPAPVDLGVLAGLVAGAAGLLLADEDFAFWTALAGVWLVLLGAAAFRASAAFAMERETRSLEALLATRTDLDEFMDGWVQAAVAPLRPLRWIAVAAPFLGLLKPERVVADSPIYGWNSPPMDFVWPVVAVLLASLVGHLAPRAGAWVGLWASAGAPDRSAARGRLLAGLAGVCGAVLLGWVLLLFPTGIAVERLRVPSQLQQIWESAALLVFPLLSALAVLGGLSRRGRAVVAPLLEDAWRGRTAPVRPGLVRGWLVGALTTVWTPGRLLLIPAAAVALTLIWRTDRGGSNPELGEMLFMMVLMAGLGLFSSATLWLVAWKPVSWLWEGVARSGWRVGPALALGLGGGALAAGSVIVALMAFPSNYVEEAHWLLLGPVLGAVVTLRETLAKRR